MIKLKWAVFMVIAVMVAGCATQKNIEAARAAEKLSLEFKPENDDKFEFAGYGKKFEFEAEKRKFLFNGVNMWMAFTANRDPFAVSIYDCENTLKPLLEGYPVTETPARKIVIDPGHGGTHPGAVGKQSEEKKLNFLIAKQVGAILEANGLEVVYTRNGDETVELAPRAALPGKVNAELFLSIHCNAAPNAAASGIETFSISPRGANNSNDDKDHSLSVDSGVDAPGYQHTVESFMLSSAIQRKLIKATGATDRGAKRARFHVLYNATVPAVLVECGFVSNEQEESMLNQREYQIKLAAAIAEGVLEYVGKKEEWAE